MQTDTILQKALSNIEEMHVLKEKLKELPFNQQQVAIDYLRSKLDYTLQLLDIVATPRKGEVANDNQISTSKLLRDINQAAQEQQPSQPVVKEKAGFTFEIPEPKATPEQETPIAAPNIKEEDQIKVDTQDVKGEPKNMETSIENNIEFIPSEPAATPKQAIEQTILTVESKELQKYIGLNDKMQIIQLIFHNDFEAFTAFLSQLNLKASKEEALTYLQTSIPNPKKSEEIENIIAYLKHLINRVFI